MGRPLFPTNSQTVITFVPSKIGRALHGSLEGCFQLIFNPHYLIFSDNDELEVVKLQLIENGYPKNLVKSEISKARVP